MDHYSLKTKPSMQVIRTGFIHNQLGAAERVTASVQTPDGRLVIGTDKGCLFLHQPFGEDRFCRISGIDWPVTAMCAAQDGRVFATSENGVFTISAEMHVAGFQPLGANAVSMTCAQDGRIYLLTEEMLYLYDGEAFIRQQAIDFGYASAMAITPAEEVFVSCKGALLKHFGKRLRWGSMMHGMTGVPAAKITAMKTDELGMLWIGCEDGLHIFDGKSEWIGPEEIAFVPKCKINVIEFAQNGAVLLGTDVGLYIVNGEKTRFYGKGRYLLGDRVYTVQACQDSTVWVGTEGGISKLQFVPFLLSEKEAYFDALSRHFKREGFVTKREATENGDIATGRVTITDNDGLWSGLYAASQSLKYAVTKDETALANARETVNAMLKLFAVSGISGFPARAYRRPGEPGFGNGNKEWHLTEDEKGPLEWKGETSSDELTGHFYAFSWYYDLCANAEEKTRISAVLKSAVDHLLSHEYTLCDTDGLPTTWAHFGPAELNLDDSWSWEKGINSLELLTFLRIVYHMTGNETYLLKQRELAASYHYAMNLTLYKKYDAHSNHIDDRLGFYNITHLLRLETDEALLRYVKFALRRHYEYERIEHTPYFHFVTAWALGGHAALDEAVETLEEYPLDTRVYRLRNSIRPDVFLEPDTAKFGEAPHARDALPVCERVTDILCDNAFRLDEYKSEDHFMSPTSWLLAYWFGRYAGLIIE